MTLQKRHKNLLTIFKDLTVCADTAWGKLLWKVVRDFWKTQTARAIFSPDKTQQGGNADDGAYPSRHRNLDGEVFAYV